MAVDLGQRTGRTRRAWENRRRDSSSDQASTAVDYADSFSGTNPSRFPRTGLAGRAGVLTSETGVRANSLRGTAARGQRGRLFATFWLGAARSRRECK